MNRFLPLFFCLIAMYGGCQLYKINDGTSSQSNIENQKALCERGVKTTAILLPEYTEMGSGSFFFDYEYEVNGKKYTTIVNRDDESPDPTVEVTYNPDNPELETRTNPCETYEKIKSKPSSYPSWLSSAGAIIFILGLGYLQSSVVALFRKS